MEFLDKYDVAIVGAGPAGSSAAIRLANAGLAILLVEQKKFPREKLCGEFISPECLVHFAELGVMEQLSAVGGTSLSETVFFARNGKGISVESSWFGEPDSLALGLSRAEMDLKLLERAMACGVDVRAGTAASGLLLDNEKVVGIKLKDKSGTDVPVSAKLTIDATGRTRSLARRFDKVAVKKPAEYVAFKTHLRRAKVAAGACEIYAYRGGYGGCNRVEDDLYNLCFIASAGDTKRLGSDAERVMREIVFTNRRAADTMQNATVAKPWLAVPIQSFGRGTLVPANGLITVGDAAAFIDPFTGSGMLMALESARIAAESVVGHFHEASEFHTLSAEYRRNYSAAFDRRLRVCSLLRHAAFIPFLAESTISVLSLSTTLRRRIARATRFSAGPAS
ncbi:MAG: NAD(P)/FAD-dependent oxidoreductase [Acidobacteriota bacterium]